MNRTQEDLFEKSYAEDPTAVSGIKENQRIGWAACLEANGIGEEPRIPEGYFKIGEEVEAKIGGEYIKCLIVARDINSPRNNSDACDVRRIPTWKPKGGEAVLFIANNGKTGAGVYSGGGGRGAS